MKRFTLLILCLGLTFCGAAQTFNSFTELADLQNKTKVYSKLKLRDNGFEVYLEEGEDASTKTKYCIYTKQTDESIRLDWYPLVGRICMISYQVGNIDLYKSAVDWLLT